MTVDRPDAASSPPTPRPTPQQVSGFYDKPDIAARFNASRDLPPAVQAVWAELITRHVPPDGVRSVLDVGCGSGRFSGLLAGCYPAAIVLGVDPSVAMLAAARAAVQSPRVSFALAAAERLPVAAASVDLVFLSMVFHHFADPARALRLVRNVLRPGGRFCVRTCTIEALDSYLYQRFIREARAVDEARFTTRAALTDAIEAAGFRRIVFDTVHQQVAANLPEYLHKVRLRAHSDLQAISDEAFEVGYAELEAWAGMQCTATAVVEDVDFFTFSAT